MAIDYFSITVSKRLRILIINSCCLVDGEVNALPSSLVVVSLPRDWFLPHLYPCLQPRCHNPLMGVATLWFHLGALTRRSGSEGRSIGPRTKSNKTWWKRLWKKKAKHQHRQTYRTGRSWPVRKVTKVNRISGTHPSLHPCPVHRLYIHMLGCI